MAIKITMPKLGLTMEEGTINSWLVKEGDYVKMGEPLFAVETDKVVIDVEARVSGSLIKVLVKEGGTVSISTVIGYIGKPGETIPDEKTQDKPNDDNLVNAAKSTIKESSIVKSEGNKRVSISPLARRLAVENNIDYSGVFGTGPGGRIVEEDINAIIKEKHAESRDTPDNLEKLFPR